MKFKILQSAFLSTCSQVLNKTLGLLSTLILARILTPSDFALIAIISVVLYFFSILTNSGSEKYIIQKTILRQDDLNTAWTLDLIIKLCITTVLVFFASKIAIFLERPQVTLGLQVASLLLVINSLKQPRLIVLKRQLNYRLLFRMELMQKLLSFCVVLFLAFSWKNFWAFIIADLVAAIFMVIASYYFIPKKPAFTLVKLKLQWEFSQWLLGKNILGYFRSQIDTLFVTKFFNNQLLGNYHLAREIAMFPGHYLLASAIEPLLASFKSVKKNKELMATQFYKAFLALSLIAIPICIFIANFGDLIINVVLGSNWQEASSLLPTFSILFIYWVFLFLLESVLTALGKVRVLFWLDFISLLGTFLVLFIVITDSTPLVTIVYLRASTGVAFALITLLLVIKTINASIIRIFVQLFWVTFISAAIAALTLSLNFNQYPAVVALLCYGICFCVGILLSYIAVLALTKGVPEHEFILQLVKVSITESRKKVG